MKSITEKINDSMQEVELNEGFFSEIKDAFLIGIKGNKELCEAFKNILGSPESRNDIATEVLADLKNQNTTIENKKALKDSVIKITKPKFKDEYGKSKYLKKLYTYDEYEKTVLDQMETIINKIFK